jgi:tetratricopeptide (TPR) repeat protein
MCTGYADPTPGDIATARELFEESLALWRQLGDARGIAYALNNLGLVAQEQEEYGTARQRFEESLTLSRELGDQYAVASLLDNLGTIARLQNDCPTARRLHEEAITMRRELGHQLGVAISLHNLASVVEQQREPAAAQLLYRESLVLLDGLGVRWAIPWSLRGLAATDLALGHAARAVRLLGAAEAQRERLGAVLSATEGEEVERTSKGLRAALDDEVYQAAWTEGQTMSIEEAVHYALQETSADVAAP